MTITRFAAAVAVSLAGLASVSGDAPEVMLEVGDAYIAQDESGRSWTIGNQGIGFRIGLNASGALVPLGLWRPGAGTPWTIEPSLGLSFQQQGRRLTPGQPGFPFQAARAEEYRGGVRLVLTFDDVTSGLRLTRSFLCYPQAPAIETWSTFEAVGSTSGIPVSDIGIWQLTVPLQEAHWVSGLGPATGDRGHFTARRQALSTDEPLVLGSSTRSATQAVPTWWFRGASGRLFGGSLWSGAWALSATSQARRGLVSVRLSAGATATTVRQGEPVESPHGMFGVAADTDIDMATALQQYIAIGLRRGRPVHPFVTYNTWYAHGTDVDDETVRAEMRSAAGLGVELFVLDAGWSPGPTSTSDYSTGLGTWTADPRRFPAGLGPLGDYARSLGLKFGVWAEPERVDTATVNRAGLARERFLATTGGRYNSGVKNEHAGAAQICFGDAEARQWVLGQLVRFIDTVRPDYLKWDNNYWINCDRTSHGHGPQDGNYAHVRGLYAVLDELRARYPDLIIENCSGGGNRLDLGMLQYTDAGWMDDVSGPSAHVRRNLQGLGTLFPARYLLSFVMDDPAEPIHRAADLPLYFRSRMPGALGMSLVGAEFSDDELADMGREIALYKRLRDVVPDPVLALLTEQVDETASGSWDAVQLSAQDIGSGVVFAFRGSGAETHARVRPMNLWPGVFYQLSTPRGRALDRVDGAALMADGVEVGGWPNSAAQVVIFTPIVQ